jgi:hypothetical protein
MRRGSHQACIPPCSGVNDALRSDVADHVLPCGAAGCVCRRGLPCAELMPRSRRVGSRSAVVSPGQGTESTPHRSMQVFLLCPLSRGRQLMIF